MTSLLPGFKNGDTASGPGYMVTWIRWMSREAVLARCSIMLEAFVGEM
jgi:hypothetical protein